MGKNICIYCRGRQAWEEVDDPQGALVGQVTAILHSLHLLNNQLRNVNYFILPSPTMLKTQNIFDCDANLTWTGEIPVKIQGALRGTLESGTNRDPI